MDYLIYLYLISVAITFCFLICFYFIEKYFDESHPIMKWWRKHVVGLNPEN